MIKVEEAKKISDETQHKYELKTREVLREIEDRISARMRSLHPKSEIILTIQRVRGDDIFQLHVNDMLFDLGIVKHELMAAGWTIDVKDMYDNEEHYMLKIKCDI